MSDATTGPPAAESPVDARTRLLLISVQFCFGVFPLLGKVAMQAFEPKAVLTWRLLVGSGVLLLVAARMHGRAAFPPLRDLGAIGVLSLLGISLNQWLFLEGLSRSTAVNAGLLMTLIPVLTLVFAVIAKMETLDLRRTTGIALSVSGVVWLFVGRDASLGGDTTTGDLLMVCNTVCYSLYLVLAKPVLVRVPHLVVVAWIFLFGACVIPWFSLDVAWAPAEAGRIEWAALAGVLLLPTVLAYIGNTIVLSRIDASVTAAYVMLQPFLAASLGILLLGERPEPRLAVTAVGVLSGLWLVSMPGRRRPAAQPS